MFIVIDTPDTVELLRYTRTILVWLKEAFFEPSSPPRHAAELYDTQITLGFNMNPAMFLYTDGIDWITDSVTFL